MQQLSTIEKINEKTLPIQLHSFERNSFVFYVLWFYFDISLTWTTRAMIR